jgi:hypothetical protein
MAWLWGSLMNYELKGMWMEAAMHHFKTLFQYLHGQAGEHERTESRYLIS